MSNRHITRVLNYNKQGNITEAMKAYSIIHPPNEGEHYYSVKELQPENTMPVINEDEIEILLTPTEFSVVQFHDTFLSLNLKVYLKCDNAVFPNMEAGGKIPGQYIALCLKSGSNIIREYHVIHNGKTISSTMHTQATVESFVYNLYKPKSEKNNRKHIHSLYESVHNYDTSLCGSYIPMDVVKAAGTDDFIVEIPVSIPLDDILIFSAFRDFPTCLFGELRLKFRLNKEALVWCQVNPLASIEKDIINGALPITAPVEADGDANPPVAAVPASFGWMFQNLCRTGGGTGASQFDYTRMFTQIGMTADLDVVTGFTDGGFTEALEDVTDANARAALSAVSVASLTMIHHIHTLQLSCTQIQCTRCSINVCGFRMKQEVIRGLLDYYSSDGNVFIIPSQRVEMKGMVAPTNNGFVNCHINTPINHTTQLVVLFPKDSKQITCFENPMLQNLQLQVGDRNLPEKAVNTTSHTFYQQMLNATDLDSVFEATDEYENSLTIPRANAQGVLKPYTDLTSFAFTVQVERSGGADIFFDGLDSNGQNRQIELRGSPIYKDEKDTYFNCNGMNSSSHPSAPMLCTTQDTFWAMRVSKQKGPIVHYYKDRDIESGRRAILAEGE